jgi:hypothetical protein
VCDRDICEIETTVRDVSRPFRGALARVGLSSLNSFAKVRACVGVRGQSERATDISLFKAILIQ